METTAPLPHRGNERLEGDHGDSTCTRHLVGILQTVGTLEPTVTIQSTTWPSMDVPNQGLTGLLAWPGLAPPLHVRPQSTCPPHLQSYLANLWKPAPPSHHPSLFLQIFKQHKRRINLRRESGREILANMQSRKEGSWGSQACPVCSPPHTCPHPGTLMLPTSNPAGPHCCDHAL